MFTAEYISVREKVIENTISELFPATSDDILNQKRQARDEFRNLSYVVKESWEICARDPVEKKPGIQQRLIDALYKYSIIPYDGLATSIQHRCYVSTIHWWVMSIESYTMY